MTIEAQDLHLVPSSSISGAAAAFFGGSHHSLESTTWLLLHDPVGKLHPKPVGTSSRVSGKWLAARLMKTMLQQQQYRADQSSPLSQ